MKPDLMGQFGPDYDFCRYGLSRIDFRGPPKRLDGRYIAFLGGTETFGKFLETPFPEQVESRLGVTAVNFGAVNAGIDLFARDQTVLAACHDAVVTVIQVPGVQNHSNRFYTVHPRRNDRFLRPTAALETLYPDIDFADFAFTRHLLLALEQCSDDRFNVVRSELQANWEVRMRGLMRRIPGPKILLWFAGSAPPLTAEGQDVMHADPLFVTRGMIDAVACTAEELLTVVPSAEAVADPEAGLSFHPLDRAAAAEMLGAAAHEEAAGALTGALQPYLVRGPV